MPAPLFCDVFESLPKDLFTFFHEAVEFSSAVDCLLTRYLVRHSLSGAELYLIHGLRHALDVFLMRPNVEDAYDINFGQAPLRLKPSSAYLLGDKYYVDSTYFPNSFALRVRLTGLLSRIRSDYYSRLGYIFDDSLINSLDTSPRLVA